MKAEDIIAGEDFQKCIVFHGHLCPGLTMGYKASVEEIFDFKEAQFDPPQKAQILPSIPCSQCGEPTMESRLVEKQGLRICKSCLPSLLFIFFGLTSLYAFQTL
ncbi:MAG: TraR/DksA C4-type zinc finger protein [Desulfobacterales bacterium]|jgi:formylmethanofuran dehydrogenase subunit E